MGHRIDSWIGWMVVMEDVVSATVASQVVKPWTHAPCLKEEVVCLPRLPCVGRILVRTAHRDFALKLVARIGWEWRAREVSCGVLRGNTMSWRPPNGLHTISATASRVCGGVQPPRRDVDPASSPAAARLGLGRLARMAASESNVCSILSLLFLIRV